MVMYGVNLQEGYKVFIQQQIFSEHLIWAEYVRKVKEQNRRISLLSGAYTPGDGTCKRQSART